MKIASILLLTVSLFSCATDPETGTLRGAITGLPYEQGADGIYRPQAPDAKTIEKFAKAAGKLRGGQSFREVLLNDIQPTK